MENKISLRALDKVSTGPFVDWLVLEPDPT